MFFADRSKILLLYRICWKLHVRNLLSIFCSRFGAGFIVSGSQDCTLKLWSVPSTLGGQAMTSLYPHLTEKAHDKDINSVVVAPNGKLIASGSQDRTVKVFCLISCYYTLQDWVALPKRLSWIQLRNWMWILICLFHFILFY